MTTPHVRLALSVELVDMPNPDDNGALEYALEWEITGDPIQAMRASLKGATKLTEQMEHSLRQLAGEPE